MKTVAQLLNRSEEIVFRELQRVADDNGLRIFAKCRLSDVIEKGSSVLTKREFDFFTRSHCDFVLTDSDTKPMMIVEYDGPGHGAPLQQERDAIKNALCRRASIGLLRIHANHVLRLYRGMTILRWIVEVRELEKAFTKAQEAGHIPWDEPFDPAFSYSINDGKRFPYWLSAPTTRVIHAFLDQFDPAVPTGWASLVGYDDDGTCRRLSCLHFGEEILWAKTSIRRQDLDFPHYDLLNEIDTCELGMRLTRYRAGHTRSQSKDEFRRVFDDFCMRHNASPSHSMGPFPIKCSWAPTNGWTFP